MYAYRKLYHGVSQMALKGLRDMQSGGISGSSGGDYQDFSQLPTQNYQSSGY